MIKKIFITIIFFVIGVLNAFAQDYLCFTSETAGSTVGIKTYSVTTPDVQYSFDKQNWRVMKSGESVTLNNVGDKVYFRGDNAGGFSTSSSYYTYFTMTGSISASGNVMSLVDIRCEETSIPSNYCFYRLFYNCKSLKSAPKLSATKLADYCYYNMFYGCTSLIKAPELPATTLAYDCYRSMFYGCSKLNYIKVAFTEWNGASTANWVQGVASKGTFVCPTELKKKEGNSYVPVGWLGESVDYTNCDYLCFTAETLGSTVGINTKSGTTPDVQYSFDKKNWIVMKSGESVTLSTKGSKVYFRGDNAGGFSTSSSYYTYFVMTGSISASGNVMSLIDESCKETSIPCDYCFFSLFYNCKNMISAPELPATKIKSYCYARMFENCSSLKYCPNLPAQELKDYCYYNMFFNCSNLISMPHLPQDNLAQSCYGYMFYGCPNISDYWYDYQEQEFVNEDVISLGVGNIELFSNKNKVKVFPNPAKAFEQITINIYDVDYNSSFIIIYNSNGVKILNITDIQEENLVSLPFGNYIGVLFDGRNRIPFKFFVE